MSKALDKIKSKPYCLQINNIEKYFLMDYLNTMQGGIDRDVIPAYVIHKEQLNALLGLNLPNKVAIKKIKLRSLPRDASEYEKHVYYSSYEVLLNEIDILKKVKTKYSIEYYGCFFTDNAIYIIMELIRSRIDLLTFIYSKKSLLTYELKMQFARQIFLAISELHKENVAHRDIKPENIMITDNTYDIKLIDFGLSCNILITPNSITCKQLILGTFGFMDPQLKDASFESLKMSDWWSYGQLLTELFIDTKKIHKRGKKQIVNIYLHNDNVLIESFPEKLQDIIKRLTNPTIPQFERPSEEELRNALFNIVEKIDIIKSSNVIDKQNKSFPREKTIMQDNHIINDTINIL